MVTRITASHAWHVIPPEAPFMINSRKHIVTALILAIMAAPAELSAQSTDNMPAGEISYITGQSIYVRFESTKHIEDGDTLFIEQNSKLIPALVVQNHSSITCLGRPVGNHELKVGDKILSTFKAPGEPREETTIPPEVFEQDVNLEVISSQREEKIKPKQHNNISGWISASSYSNFFDSNDGKNNNHRFRYTLSMSVMDEPKSKISAETYLSYTHRLNPGDAVRANLKNSFKIYSLALKYNIDASSTVWAGRKINPNIANIGAVDGIQFQKQWNNLYLGTVVGFRPDYSDYGFNPDLLEYGAYFGHNSKTENGFVQTSLAIFDQRNAGNTDRRFAYFQHSNSLIKDIHFFSSFEVDLYELKDGEPYNTARLTSMYLSLRYRVSRKLSLFGSYDNRKNVIYYETFKNYADEVIQLASRQGVALRVNYRPVNYMSLGINAGTRFRKEDPRPTKTLRGYASYNKIPAINTSLSLSGNLMQTSYLDGQVYGARLSKEFMAGKLYSSINYRRVKFDYVKAPTQLRQHIGEVDVSYRFNQKLYFSVNYEATFQEDENFNTLYINLRQKF